MYVFIRNIYVWRNEFPTELFMKALKNENKGKFEEAVITYETALMEFNKSTFHREFKNKIMGKIKLLHTVIEYQKNTHFIRNERIAVNA